MTDNATSNNFMLTPPLEESNAALEDIDERNWDDVANDELPQLPPPLHPLEVIKEAGVEPFAETPKTPKKRGPRKKAATPTIVATPNTRSHARTSQHCNPPPTPRKPKSAPTDALFSHPKLLTSSQRHIDLSYPSPALSSSQRHIDFSSPSPTPSSSFSVEELHSYVLDAFDSIISPLIPPPPEPTPSSHVVRRTLFRKQFSNEALTLIHHPSKPITSLDDLIPIIQIACARSNLFLA